MLVGGTFATASVVVSSTVGAAAAAAVGCIVQNEQKTAAKFRKPTTNVVGVQASTATAACVVTAQQSQFSGIRLLNALPVFFHYSLEAWPQQMSNLIQKRIQRRENSYYGCIERPRRQDFDTQNSACSVSRFAAIRQTSACHATIHFILCSSFGQC